MRGRRLGGKSHPLRIRHVFWRGDNIQPCRCVCRGGPHRDQVVAARSHRRRGVPRPHPARRATNHHPVQASTGNSIPSGGGNSTWHEREGTWDRRNGLNRTGRIGKIHEGPTVRRRICHFRRVAGTKRRGQNTCLWITTQIDYAGPSTGVQRTAASRLRMFAPFDPRIDRKVPRPLSPGTVSGDNHGFQRTRFANNIPTLTAKEATSRSWTA